MSLSLQTRGKKVKKHLSTTFLETTDQYQFYRPLVKLWNGYCMINCITI